MIGSCAVFVRAESLKRKSSYFILQKEGQSLTQMELKVARSCILGHVTQSDRR